MPRHSEQTRDAALALYAAGLTAREAAEQLGLKRSTVQGWVTSALVARPWTQPIVDNLEYKGGWVRDGLILRPAKRAA